MRVFEDFINSFSYFVILNLNKRLKFILKYFFFIVPFKNHATLPGWGAGFARICDLGAGGGFTAEGDIRLGYYKFK